jgi:N-acetylmuramoyl-L-alanine amidase
MPKRIFILGISMFMLAIGAAPANAAAMHNIRNGESLYIIAVNNSVSVNQLKQANDLKGDLIYAGGKLILPAKDKVSQKSYHTGDIDLLARIITAEAGSEPFKGQVAVASVILNRLADGKFPATVAGNIFKENQFESVSNGLIWQQPTADAYKAAEAALKGWDPTYGAKYFFNPAKVKGPSWVWSRRIIERIGNHVFGI